MQCLQLTHILTPACLQVVQQLDLHSAAAMGVVCRMLLPSACSWVLTASAAATAKSREPLSTGSSSRDWLCNSTCDSSSPPGAVAGAYYQPDHLVALFQLVEAAEQIYSKQAQHTPASVHLLQLTFDCCMAVWPVGAFDEVVLQQLLQHTLPALLSSSHSLAAMTGLRALHHAVLRGLLGSVECNDACSGPNDGADQQQKQQAGEQLLVEAWQRPQGLCCGVCRLLESGDSAVRLEVGHVHLFTSSLPVV